MERGPIDAPLCRVQSPLAAVMATLLAGLATPASPPQPPHWLTNRHLQEQQSVATLEEALRASQAATARAQDVLQRARQAQHVEATSHAEKALADALGAPRTSRQPQSYRRRWPK